MRPQDSQLCRVLSDAAGPGIPQSAAMGLSFTVFYRMPLAWAPLDETPWVSALLYFIGCRGPGQPNPEQPSRYFVRANVENAL